MSGFLIVFSCKDKILQVEIGSDLSEKSARESFENDFLTFNFNKFDVEPIWDKAMKLSGNVVEVPYKYKNKIFRPRLKDFPNVKEQGNAKLILHRKGKEVVAEAIYYFPSIDFKGNLDEINVRNYKSKKFSGVYMFQKLGESNMHIGYVSDGKIIKRRAVPNGPNIKNARLMDCVQWGVFLDTYENGELVQSDLLWTYWVGDTCGGGPNDEDQAAPGGGGGDASGFSFLAGYVKEIDNNLKKPCYKNVANYVFGWSSLNNEAGVGKMLSSLMPTTTQKKIFLEEEDNSDRGLDGRYLAGGGNGI